MMQPPKERIQGYLDTIDTYGADSENCYWTPTKEAFKELCELALKALAARPEVRDTVSVPRSLAERTEAMFRSVDPEGSIAQEWRLHMNSCPINQEKP